VSLDKTISEGRKRWIMSMRTTNDGRERLRLAAEANGRSLSEEIENRLERTFQSDDAAGGFANAAFVSLIGAIIRDVEAQGRKSWQSDYETWASVRQKVVSELDQREPSKKTARPGPAKPASARKATDSRSN
jgi:hypothetical protein